MYASRPAPRRPSFTLVELLVVISIILLLATLGYLLLPGMFSNYRRVGAVDRVSQWLLTARQRAKRDGVPTGLRLLPVTDANGKVVVNPDGSVWVRQLQYVQQPEPLVGGALTPNLAGGPPTFSGGYCVSVTNGVVTFNNVDFVAGGSTVDEYLVQPGDYLELFGGGSVHLIANVTGTTLTLNDTTVNYPAPFQPTTNYRILRQPRPLLGEKALDVPGDTVIDLGKPARSDANGNPLSFQPAPAPPDSRSLNVPERLVGLAPQQKLVLEVVFSPSGAVLTQNTGKVILWLRDSTATPPDLGSPSLIGIPVRTGFIGAYDVAPGNNPYQYTENGRASGL
jgi:prepilin-type N-terminal cleavage/methylation domain-containing protein